MTEALVCSCTISYAGCSLFKWTPFCYRTHILNFQSCKFLDAAWFASLCVLFVLEVCFHKLHSFSHPRIPHLLSGKAYLLIFARSSFAYYYHVLLSTFSYFICTLASFLYVMEHKKGQWF